MVDVILLTICALGLIGLSMAHEMRKAAEYEEASKANAPIK